MDNNNPLTLEILCAHMAYGLTSRYGQDGTNYPPIAIERFWRHGTTGEIWIGPNASFLGIELKEAKLLLRPMSDMDKPLEELGGKTTMQLIKESLEAAKFGWPEIYIEDTEAAAGIYILRYSDSISIRCVPDYYMVPMEAFEIIRKTLLSLKYDLYGGIASGWALDLNEHGK